MAYRNGLSKENGYLCGISFPIHYKVPEPMTGNLFMTRYTDCILNEDHFPALEKEF
jgi:hypothetical protein